MLIFISDHNYKLWEIISKGYFVPTMKEGDKIIPKPSSAFTHEEIEKVTKNYKASSILFCGLDSNEFNCVSACDIAREIRDKLETTSNRIFTLTI